MTILWFKYIKIITKLLDDGYAYISGGNVYFDISKLDDYYVLTNHQEDQMVVGVREGVEVDNNKEDDNKDENNNKEDVENKNALGIGKTYLKSENICLFSLQAL